MGTYFHYNEIRPRWPERLHEIGFMAIEPDRRVLARLGRERGKARRRRLLVCELDEAKARNIAADVGAALSSSGWDVRPAAVKRANELLTSSREKTPILFSSRVWDQLTAGERSSSELLVQEIQQRLELVEGAYE